MRKIRFATLQLLYERTCVKVIFFKPKILNNKHFFTVHDSEYLSTFKHTLPKLIDQEKLDIIYYLCGINAIETDKLGKL